MPRPSRTSSFALLFAFTLTSVMALLGACSKNDDRSFVDDEEGSLLSDAAPDTAQPDADLDAKGAVNDARPDVIGQCFDGGETKLGPGPVQRICFPPTENECDGQHDFGIGFPPNGKTGNGYDDDCDGLVDEGCSCDGTGTTKDCFLVPAIQTYGGEPVGWCKENSRGTMACNGSEFPHWTGICRGAQVPFADDFCAVGDFDCDGRDLNSKTADCACNESPVVCPSDALLTKPFPDPKKLPLLVDGAKWLREPSDVGKVTNWKWSVRGGDCDNILPHPTFGIYATANAEAAPLGTQNDTLGLSGKEHGMEVAAPLIGSSIYPAFSLSGDYIVTGEFDLEGRHYACNQKVQVRAPGVRAEACWSTAGSVDLDLHVAVTNRAPFTFCDKKGWSDTCEDQDCYYGNCKNDVSWYGDSPASACVGWGSKSTGAVCKNPRLDRDLISATCGTNPNDQNFCGSENINIDAPEDGDVFAVELVHFGGAKGGLAHINLYCNGERVLSSGYDPTATPASPYPLLDDSGGNTGGDIWKMGLIAAHVKNGVLSCDVQPTKSAVAYPSGEGPVSTPNAPGAYCVDNSDRNGQNAGSYLTPLGIIPHKAQDLCFH